MANDGVTSEAEIMAAATATLAQIHAMNQGMAEELGSDVGGLKIDPETRERGWPGLEDSDDDQKQAKRIRISRARPDYEASEWGQMLTRMKELDAPLLPVELSSDLLWALERVSKAYGGRIMNQEALKVFQALPLVWSGLGCKESGGTISGDTRSLKTSTTYMEYASPAFIALLKESKIPLPVDLEERMPFTTLGTGKNPAKTFAEVQTTVWTKFDSIKTEYTKTASEWFSKNYDEKKDLPSGTQTSDLLERLCEDLYAESEAKKAEEAAKRRRKKEKNDAAHDLTVKEPESSCSSNVPSKPIIPGEDRADVAEDKHSGCAREDEPGFSLQLEVDSDDPSASWDPCSTESSEGGGGAPISIPGDAPSSRTPSLAEPVKDDGDREPTPMPAGWFPSYILLAAAWSPWSGCVPEEWRHLEMSSGPANKSNVNEEPGCKNENPLSNPGVLKRHSAKGDPMSRRRTANAVQEEKVLQQRHEAEKESSRLVKESMETRQRGVAAMEESDTHAKGIHGNLSKMVELRGLEVESGQRASTISHLEKLLALNLGDQVQVKAALTAALLEGGGLGTM